MSSGPSTNGQRADIGASGEPHLEERGERTYVAIPTVVSLDGESAVIPTLLGEVTAWMTEHGIDPTGAPFVRYRVIDMPARMEIDVGFPVDAPVATEGRVRSAQLPAGSYAVAVHTGALEELVEANAALRAWGDDRGLAWATAESDRGTVWDARTETYLTDPDDGSAVQRVEIAYLAR